MGDPVVLDIRDRVAVLTLDRPPLNLFDVAMRDALLTAVLAVRDLPDIGAMVLRSQGTHFGAGADLSEFGSADHILDARRIRWDRDPWGPLIDLPVPTIAAIDGLALGSALEMALLCDLRICTVDSRLGLPEIALGMLPGAGGTQSLGHCIGPVAALPLIAVGTQLTAVEAAARGLVHRVVATEDLFGEVMSVANDVAHLPAALTMALRRSLRAAADLPLDAGLDVERNQARAVRVANAARAE